VPKIPRLTAKQAEKMLLDADFELLRSEGSHRIYGKQSRRVVVPFHSGRILHPKIIKQVIQAIEND
jgi:predicted RNA binding protein YcfA (HicA-like mRNA interferase family)